MTVIPIVVEGLGTVLKNQEKRHDEMETRRIIENIQTTLQLNQPGY